MLMLLAIQAQASPGDRGQAHSGYGPVTDFTDPVVAPLNSRQSLVDRPEQPAVGLVQPHLNRRLARGCGLIRRIAMQRFRRRRETFPALPARRQLLALDR